MSSDKYYNQIAETYFKESNANIKKYHQMRFDVFGQLLSLARLPDDAQIFDFGCGSGELFEFLLQYNKSWKISGCDSSEQMVVLAKSLCERNNLDPERVKTGSVELLETIEQQLDAVFAINVLTYLSPEDEQSFFSNAIRALKPGGIIIVSHANELFDIVTFNKYTLDFFNRRMINFLEGNEEQQNYMAQAMRLLLQFPDEPKIIKLADSWVVGSGINNSERDVVEKRRSDPFEFGSDKESLHKDLKHIATIPLNFFPFPPSILESRDDLYDLQLEAYRRGSKPHLKLLFSTQFQALFRKHSPT